MRVGSEEVSRGHIVWVCLRADRTCERTAICLRGGGAKRPLPSWLLAQGQNYMNKVMLANEVLMNKRRTPLRRRRQRSHMIVSLDYPSNAM